MIPSILSVVAMPSLKYDHEPADSIWSDSGPLRVDRGESKVLNELNIGCQKQERCPYKVPRTVGRKYDTVATPTLTGKRKIRIWTISDKDSRRSQLA